MKNTYMVKVGAHAESGPTFTNVQRAKRYLRNRLEAILERAGPSECYDSTIHRNGDEYPILIAGITTGKVKFELA